MVPDRAKNILKIYFRFVGRRRVLALKTNILYIVKQSGRRDYHGTECGITISLCNELIELLISDLLDITRKN